MPELPSGFDRADGLEGRLGTLTPEGAVIVQSAGGSSAIPVEELPDSPTFERAEQATVTHKFSMSIEEAFTRLQFYARGTLLTDSFDNVTKVLSAQAQVVGGTYAVLTVVAEGLSFDSPPDRFCIVPVELGINILKHPRYFHAFLGEGQGSSTELKNQMVIRLLQDYFENTTAAYRDALTRLIYDSLDGDTGVGTQPPSYTNGQFEIGSEVSGTDMAKRAALEIIQKYWRGEETPYIVGYQMTWSAYYFRPQPLNPGGYVEDPMMEATPQVPDYFFSTAFPPDPSQTIFDLLSQFNPQSYSADGTVGGAVTISWLRKADTMEEERTWFKVDRTWFGSPVGHWDTELYTSAKRPTTAAEYLVINPYATP